MRPPAAPSRALPAVAALVALAACSATSDITICPGGKVGTFDLIGTRVAASCPGADGTAESAPADGDDACRDSIKDWAGSCQDDRPVPACCFDRLFKRQFETTATITYGSAGVAAFCTAYPGATPYLGTRSQAPGGELIAVSTDTSSALLGSCNPFCAVKVHHAVTGLLTVDPVSGAATGFSGEHVEVAEATDLATCTPCQAPCTATWTLTPKY